MRAQCLFTNAAHLHRNSKRGGTLSIQALERGDEAAAAGVAITGQGIVALPDTVHKLGITAEPACMYMRARIHDEHVGKVG